jgi:hypothetical protein
VKEKLKNIQMIDEDDLFCRLQELLNEMPIKELRKVFGAWTNWLLDVNRGIEAIYVDR